MKRNYEELKVLKSLVSWLKFALKGAFFIHVPNEGKRGFEEAALFDAIGCRRGASDLLFFDRRQGFNGLAVELKIKDPYYLNGNCKHPDQEEFLIELRERGWKAEFAVGYKDAKKIISEYYDIL